MQRLCKIALSVLTVVCALATITPGRAASVVYSNIKPGDTYVIGVGIGLNPFDGVYNYAGIGFKARQNYTFEGMELAVSLASGPNELYVYLMSNLNGLPGVELESFTLTDKMSTDSATGVVKIVSVVHPELLAGQEYWVVAVENRMSRVRGPQTDRLRATRGPAIRTLPRVAGTHNGHCHERCRRNGRFHGARRLRDTAAIIQADRKERPSPVGTGINVSYAGRHYLLTAHHVTATHLEGVGAMPDSPLYAFVPERWEIGGASYNIGDPFDVSITEMPVTPRKALHFPRHFAFDAQPGELCFVFGYPARSKSWDMNLSRGTMRPIPLTYLGRVYKASATGFSVKLSRKHVSSRGRKLQHFGKLSGISGGGAFVLRNDAPRLAGVIISNTAEIVCTSSNVVATLFGALGTA